MLGLRSEVENLTGNDNARYIDTEKDAHGSGISAAQNAHNDAGSGGTVAVGDENISPNKFSLKQNYPNPFNPKTQIQFNLSHSGDVVLDLFDIRGAKIKTLVNKYHEAGAHKFTLDGTSLASGVYFYSLTVNGDTKTRKLALMK